MWKLLRNKNKKILKKKRKKKKNINKNWQYHCGIKMYSVVILGKFLIIFFKEFEDKLETEN